MSQTVVDIERIVREILAEMVAAPTVEARTDVAQASTDIAVEGTESSSERSNDALVLTDRLVTLEQLGRRTPTMRRLVVPEDAVVTPAVRDELRRRGMTLEYGSAAAPASAGTCKLAVWNVSKRYDPAPLTTMLRREGMPVELETSTCLIATTDALAAEVRRGRAVGLILTRQPAVALCLANRHVGVRAVIGLDAPQVAADLAAMGGNVLAVDWSNRTLFQIKQMTSELCRGAPRDCPEELKQRLA